MYVRRRRGALIGAVLALLLAQAAFAGGSRSRSATARHVLNDKARASLSAVRWPLRGQAALALGNDRAAASPHAQPAPIASLAKVMTAYLTLERYPLSGAQDGFTITVTEAQAHVEAQGQSVVAVRAGELVTERQLLEALLVPSGNNIAWMLAAQVAGSEPRFIDEMNAEARALGGYAGKTGSDSAAGGCLAFFTHVTAGGRRLTAVGVVLGQGQGSDTSAILAAAGEAATQLVESVAPAIRVRAIAGGPGGDAGRHGAPRLLAPGRASAQN